MKLEWVPVQGPEGKPYFYPDDHKRLRKCWSKPVVYRWALSGQRRTLVGETGNLYERVQAYVGSGLGRHIEIRRVFDEELKSGGTVGLEVLKFDTFKINGVMFDEQRLHSTFVRVVLENLCCAVLSQQGVQLLNVTPEKRAFGKMAQELNVLPEVLEEAIRTVRSRKTTSTSTS